MHCPSTKSPLDRACINKLIMSFGGMPVRDVSMKSASFRAAAEKSRQSNSDAIEKAYAVYSLLSEHIEDNAAFNKAKRDILSYSGTPHGDSALAKLSNNLLSEISALSKKRKQKELLIGAAVVKFANDLSVKEREDIERILPWDIDSNTDASMVSLYKEFGVFSSEILPPTIDKVAFAKDVNSFLYGRSVKNPTHKSILDYIGYSGAFNLITQQEGENIIGYNPDTRKFTLTKYSGNTNSVLSSLEYMKNNLPDGSSKMAIDVNVIGDKSAINDIVKAINEYGYLAEYRPSYEDIVVSSGTVSLFDSVNPAESAAAEALYSNVTSLLSRFYEKARASSFSDLSEIKKIDAVSTTDIDGVADVIISLLKASSDMASILSANAKREAYIDGEGLQQAYRDVHFISYEILPTVDGIKSSLMSVESLLDNDTRDRFNKAREAYDRERVKIKDVESIAIAKAEDELSRMYGYNRRMFTMDSAIDDASNIIPFLYYFKFARESSDKSIRLIDSLIHTMQSSVDKLKLPFISRMDDIRRAYGYKDVKSAYDWSGNNKSVKTGYLTSNYKWDEFRHSYDNLLDNLSNMLGFRVLGTRDVTVPANQWSKYINSVIKWEKNNLELDENTVKYLDAIAKLSKPSYVAYTTSRAQIKKRANDLTYLDVVNNTDRYKAFIDSYAKYRALFVDVDSNGDPKSPEALIVAKELSALSEELSNIKIDNVDDSGSNISKLHSDLKKYIIDEKGSVDGIDQTDFSRMISLSRIPLFFSGSKESKDTDEEKKTKIREHWSVELSKAMNAGGANMNAFEAASDNLKAKMASELSEYLLSQDASVLSRYASSPRTPEYIKIDKDDPNKHITVNHSSGVYVIPHPLLMSPAYTGKDFGRVNPLFFPQKRSSGSEYSYNPKKSVYWSGHYDSLNKRQQSFVDEMKSILDEINANYGTSLQMGPVLPQLTGKHINTKYLRETGDAIGSLTHKASNTFGRRNDSLDNIAGFGNMQLAPYELYAKNTKMLDHPNTINRDIYKLLHDAYVESLKASQYKKYAYPIYSIMAKQASLGRNESSTVSKNQLYSWLGMEVSAKRFSEKALPSKGIKRFLSSINYDNVSMAVAKGVRSFYLPFNLASIFGNSVNSVFTAISDGRFIKAGDSVGCMSYMTHALVDAMTDSFTTRKPMSDNKLVKCIQLLGGEDTGNRYRNTAYHRQVSNIMKHSFYGPYSAIDVAIRFPIVYAILKNIKMEDGVFYNKYSYQRHLADSGFGNYGYPEISTKSLEKAADKMFDKIDNNLFDMLEFADDGSVIIPDGVSEESFNGAIAMAKRIFMIKHQLAAGNKEGSAIDFADGFFGPQIMLFKGWAIAAFNDAVSSAHFDPILGVNKEGYLNSMFESTKDSIRTLMDAVVGYQKDERKMSALQRDHFKALAARLAFSIFLKGIQLGIASLAIKAAISLGNKKIKWDGDGNMVYIAGSDEDDPIENMDIEAMAARAIVAAYSYLSRACEDVSSMINPYDLFTTIVASGDALKAMGTKIASAKDAVVILLKDILISAGLLESPRYGEKNYTTHNEIDLFDGSFSRTEYDKFLDAMSIMPYLSGISRSVTTTRGRGRFMYDIKSFPLNMINKIDEDDLDSDGTVKSDVVNKFSPAGEDSFLGRTYERSRQLIESGNPYIENKWNTTEPPKRTNSYDDDGGVVAR